MIFSQIDSLDSHLICIRLYIPHVLKDSVQ